MEKGLSGTHAAMIVEVTRRVERLLANPTPEPAKGHWVSSPLHARAHRLKAMCKVAKIPADARARQPRRTAITAANFAFEWT